MKSNCIYSNKVNLINLVDRSQLHVGDYVCIFKDYSYDKLKEKNNKISVKYEGCIIKIHKNMSLHLFNQESGYVSVFFLQDPNINIKIYRKYYTMFNSLRANLYFLTRVQKNKSTTKKHKLLKPVKKKHNRT